MKFTLLASLIIFALSAQAADKGIYSTDAMGNKRYDKQSYRIEGDKILPTDSIGNRQY